MPLNDDFWEDEEASKSAWQERDMPAKEHPATMSWTFIDFVQGGIHVVHHAAPWQALCRLAQGEGQWTDEWTSCKSCWAWLAQCKDEQDRNPPG